MRGRIRHVRVQSTPHQALLNAEAMPVRGMPRLTRNVSRKGLTCLKPVARRGGVRPFHKGISHLYTRVPPGPMGVGGVMGETSPGWSDSTNVSAPDNLAAETLAE